MNYKAKAAVVLKALCVWWGIFLILGCCAGFCIKVLFGLFFVSGNRFTISLGQYIPIMIAGSLVLAVAAYLISMLVHKAPIRRLRKKLDAVYTESGVSKEYIELLCSNCRGDVKNALYVELASAYAINGSFNEAKATLDRIDIISVLDIAQSTGNFCTAAYYYAAAVIIYLKQDKPELAAAAYNNGSFYLNELAEDSYIAAVKGLYLHSIGKDDEARSALDAAKHWKLSNFAGKVYWGCTLTMKAVLLNALGNNDLAVLAARQALDCKLTPFLEEQLGTVLRRQQT